MSEGNSIQQQARRGVQAVKDAVENVTGAAEDQARGASEAAESVAENVASSASSQAGSAFAQHLLDAVEQQAQQQYRIAGQLAISWTRAYGQILTTSTNIYLDGLLRGWEYNRNVLDSTGRALEDAVDLQRRLMSEMSRTHQGYIDSIEEQYGNAQR